MIQFATSLVSAVVSANNASNVLHRPPAPAVYAAVNSSAAQELQNERSEVAARDTVRVLRDVGQSAVPRYNSRSLGNTIARSGSREAYNAMNTVLDPISNSTSIIGLLHHLDIDVADWIRDSK